MATKNKVDVGAWFEEWCEITFDLKLAGIHRSGYDAVDSKGLKYQIKIRDNSTPLTTY
jgi:hypothetical protein